MTDLITETEQKIGYTFRNKDLLRRALTHSSYLNEHREVEECNERLEFLGDSVLSLICSDHLYHTREGDEGALTKTKALLVCEEALSTFAKELNLGESLLLGRGEKQAGAENRASILCDEIEAILGARTPISRSPLEKNPMPGHLSELHPVNEVHTKGQFFRASFGKNPRFQIQLDKRPLSPAYSGRPSIMTKRDARSVRAVQGSLAQRCTRMPRAKLSARAMEDSLVARTIMIRRGIA